MILLVLLPTPKYEKLKHEIVEEEKFHHILVNQQSIPLQWGQNTKFFKYVETP